MMWDMHITWGMCMTVAGVLEGCRECVCHITSALGVLLKIPATSFSGAPSRRPVQPHLEKILIQGSSASSGRTPRPGLIMITTVGTLRLGSVSPEKTLSLEGLIESVPCS